MTVQYLLTRSEDGLGVVFTSQHPSWEEAMATAKLNGWGRWGSSEFTLDDGVKIEAVRVGIDLGTEK